MLTVGKTKQVHLIIGENIIARIVIETPEKPPDKLARLEARN